MEDAERGRFDPPYHDVQWQCGGTKSGACCMDTPLTTCSLATTSRLIVMLPPQEDW
jgi:hypothetical protein